MPDKLTAEQRHKNMAAIKGRDTKPEMIVRHYLWQHGFRYRLSHGRLPGRPDIVLRKYKTCIFVNGCFWHGHNITEESLSVVSSSNSTLSTINSNCCKIPKSNTSFWINKIRRNKERDERVQHELARLGWHCISLWECQLKPGEREQTLRSLAFTLNTIYLNNNNVRRYDFVDEEKGQIAADDSGIKSFDSQEKQK